LGLKISATSAKERESHIGDILIVEKSFVVDYVDFKTALFEVSSLYEGNIYHILASLCRFGAHMS
jgi:hypothetical protein